MCYLDTEILDEKKIEQRRTFLPLYNINGTMNTTFQTGKRSVEYLLKGSDATKGGLFTSYGRREAIWI